MLLTYPQTALPTAFDQRIPNPQAATVSLRPGEILALGVLGAGNYASAVFLPAVQTTGGIAPVGIASASGLSARHAAQNALASAIPPARRKRNPRRPGDQHRGHPHPPPPARPPGAAGTARRQARLLRETAGHHAGRAGRDRAAFLGEEGTPLLTVGFNRRFAPLASARSKAFIADRAEPLAAHYRVNAGYLPLNHWTQDPPQGGGRIIGEGCHFIDFLTFLVGEPPVSVSAQALPDAGRYRQDNVLLTFTFPDGSLGTLTYLANGDKSFAKERVEVFCGGRIAVLDDFRSLELVRRGRRWVLRSRLRQDKGHQAGWEAFLSAVRAGGPPPIPYPHILGVTRATFAAVEALRNSVQTLLRIQS